MEIQGRVPPAYLVMRPGTPEERAIPVYDSLYVGRDWAQVEEGRRFLISDDGQVSRDHLEVRLDLQRDLAFVIDTSTNGTRVNGLRIDSAKPVRIRPTDRIVAGSTEFEFRSESFRAEPVRPAAHAGPRPTALDIRTARMIMVVGDIVGYSTISQYTAGEIIVLDLEVLYGALKGLLSEQKGTLSDYAGDAVLTVWEVGILPEAPSLAIDFALKAVDLVAEVGPSLRIRDPEGNPVHMGWAISHGLVAVSALTGSLVSVVGDATNLAFRLSGIAGRQGRAPVVVTAGVHDLVPDHYRYGPPDEVETKGRSGMETVYELFGPAR